LAAFGLTASINVVALAQDSSPPTPSSPAATDGKHVEGTLDEAERANDPNASARPRGRRHHENDDQGENEDNTTKVRTTTIRREDRRS
jgi:hypothetical protein